LIWIRFICLQVWSKPGRVPGGSRGCKEEEVPWAVRDCRDRSSSFRAAKRVASHLGPVRRDKGAPEGPRSRAARGRWCCSGSKSCRGRSRQRKAAGECEGEGATTLNVKRQDAADGGLGSQGCRSRSYGKSRGAEPGLSKAREAGMSGSEEAANNT
jgi:hypothetical protein